MDREHDTRVRARRWTPGSSLAWRATCACGWRSDPIGLEHEDAYLQAVAAARAHPLEAAARPLADVVAEWARRYR